MPTEHTIHGSLFNITPCATTTKSKGALAYKSLLDGLLQRFTNGDWGDPSLDAGNSTTIKHCTANIPRVICGRYYLGDVTIVIVADIVKLAGTILTDEVLISTTDEIRGRIDMVTGVAAA